MADPRLLAIILFLLSGAFFNVGYAGSTKRNLTLPIEIGGPLSTLLILLMIVFGYLLVRQDFWLALLALVLGFIPPTNVISTLVSSIFVIPLAWIIAKIRGVKI